jgi:hypothetical protein
MLVGSALGVLTTPLISVAFAASIVTCFAPEQDCAGLAIGAIDAARQEILVSAYVLTNGPGFPAALVAASRSWGATTFQPARPWTAKI